MSSPATIFLTSRLDAALPQTQCTRCGYADCAAYADAIATSDAAINQCPPGGAEGVVRLAQITGWPVLKLNPVHGLEAPRAIAVIDEAWCIGCTLCLSACPVDAILGSNKAMHTVIEHHCTGCELCLPVCPVDCISLENVSGARTGWNAWSSSQAESARIRYAFHSNKKARDKRESTVKSDVSSLSDGKPLNASPALPEAHAATPESKRLVIAAALAKSRLQRGGNA